MPRARPRQCEPTGEPPQATPGGLRKRASRPDATKAIPTKRSRGQARDRRVGEGRRAKPKAHSQAPPGPAPRQGFETESDPVSGPVQPPGGVDLLASAAELAGELTKSGLSTGGRLLKDVFARLPLN